MRRLKTLDDAIEAVSQARTLVLKMKEDYTAGTRETDLLDEFLDKHDPAPKEPSYSPLDQ